MRKLIRTIATIISIPFVAIAYKRRRMRLRQHVAAAMCHEALAFGSNVIDPVRIVAAVKQSAGVGLHLAAWATSNSPEEGLARRMRDDYLAVSPFAVKEAGDMLTLGEVQALNALIEDRQSGELNPYYWTCMCDKGRVHSRWLETSCDVCQSKATDMPDAAWPEVKDDLCRMSQHEREIRESHE